MLIYNNKEISVIFYKDKPIQSVYHLGRLVWQSVRSCFGGGYWRNDKPWMSKEPWK